MAAPVARRSSAQAAQAGGTLRQVGRAPAGRDRRQLTPAADAAMRTARCSRREARDEPASSARRPAGMLGSRLDGRARAAAATASPRLRLVRGRCAAADRADEAAPVAPADATDGRLEWYFHDADAEIVLMERALKRYEATTVAASAGRLADASLAVGAALVTPIAAELETRARAHDLSVAAHLLASLERALMATKAASSDPLDAIFAVGGPAPSHARGRRRSDDVRDPEWDAPAFDKPTAGAVRSARRGERPGCGDPAIGAHQRADGGDAVARRRDWRGLRAGGPGARAGGRERISLGRRARAALADHRAARTERGRPTRGSPASWRRAESPRTQVSRTIACSSNATRSRCGSTTGRRVQSSRSATPRSPTTGTRAPSTSR